MNKKKLLIMLSSVALIAVVGVGATLAYFTDSTELFNEVVTGYVDITISENKITVDQIQKELLVRLSTMILSVKKGML